MIEFTPLGDVRVLNLSRGGGAAICARLLRQLGAAVVAGDPAERSARPLFEAPDLVLSDLRQLAEVAAHFWQGGRTPGQGHVVVSVTPYGLIGPDDDRDPETEPDLDLDGPIACQLVGAHAAVAALGALRWARRHGRDVLVEIAAIEVLAGCLGTRMPDAVCSRRGGAVPARDITDSHATVMPCADGYLVSPRPRRMIGRRWPDSPGSTWALPGLARVLASGSGRGGETTRSTRPSCGGCRSFQCLNRRRCSAMRRVSRGACGRPRRMGRSRRAHRFGVCRRAREDHGRPAAGFTRCRTSRSSTWGWSGPVRTAAASSRVSEPLSSRSKDPIGRTAHDSRARGSVPGRLEISIAERRAS